MKNTPRPGGWLAFLGGAGLFLSVQWLLFRNPTPIPGIEDSGWFLNSDIGVTAVSAACAVAGLFTGLASSGASGVRNATLVVIGAASAMALTLLRIGPGTIFPIVIFFGAAIIAVTTAAGAAVGIGVRRWFALRQGAAQ